MKAFFFLPLLLLLSLSVSCQSEARKLTQNKEETAAQAHFTATDKKLELGPRGAQAAQAFEESMKAFQRVSMEIYHQDRVTVEQNMALYAKIDKARRDCFLKYNEYLRAVKLDTVTEWEFWQSQANTQADEYLWEGETYDPVSNDSTSHTYTW
jgi:hypothetical protein